MVKYLKPRAILEDMTIIELPDEVRRLQEPWFDEDIPEEVEWAIRNSGGIDEMPDRLLLYSFVSGGAGTTERTAIDEETAECMRALMEREYFTEAHDNSAAESLAQFLDSRGVQLDLKEECKSDMFTLIESVYSLLPEHHFGHKHFTKLRIGRWGGGAAKYSCYDDPAVHLFSFVAWGAKRNLIALLLHETGHAHLEMLKESEPHLAQAIRECWEQLHPLYQNADDFPAVDYLWGKEMRAEYMLASPTEFAAEFYLMYVTQGTRLIHFINSQEPEAKDIFGRLYLTFKESFKGLEYR